MYLILHSCVVCMYTCLYLLDVPVFGRRHASRQTSLPSGLPGCGFCIEGENCMVMVGGFFFSSGVFLLMSPFLLSTWCRQPAPCSDKEGRQIKRKDSFELSLSGSPSWARCVSVYAYLPTRRPAYLVGVDMYVSVCPHGYGDYERARTSDTTTP